MIITIDQDEGVTDATHNRLMRESLRETMRIHLRGGNGHESRMGLHFQHNAKTAPGGPYGYISRTLKYLARKIRKVGHTRPNFFFGTLARECRNQQITATAKRSRVILRAPAGRKFTLQRRLELEAITPDEEVEIAQTAGALYSKEAAKPKNRRRRKRRIQ